MAEMHGNHRNIKCLFVSLTIDISNGTQNKRIFEKYDLPND